MISFSGLRSALEKFEENGDYAKCGKWSIAKGGFRPIPDFTEEAEKELIKKVKTIYTDLQDNEVANEEVEMKTYKCTISITDGEQTEEQDFFVEAESFEDAVAMIKSDLDI